MQYEHRQFLRRHTDIAEVQLRFVEGLLEMHAAMIEGLIPHDTESHPLSMERRYATALDIAGVLHTYNCMFKDWRELDRNTTRIADQVINSAEREEE